MNPVPKDELETLMQVCDEPCISIYMPTARAARDTRQNAIRFRNLVRQADESLEEMGLSADARRGLLEPLHEMADDHDFWQHQEEGLALLRSGKQLRTYRLPMAVEELCVVEERFHLKPLLSLYASQTRFHLLRLDQDRVRLFHADQYGLEEIEVDGPTSLEDAVGHDIRQQHLQYHGTRSASEGTGVGPVGAGPSDPIYHSKGEGEDDVKGEIRKWFTMLRDDLQPHLKGGVPIVLAGSAVLAPIFREATDFEILDETVKVANGVSSDEDIHAEAWKVMEAWFLRDLNEAAESIGFLQRSGMASSDIDEVVTAAFDGRVATLYVSRDDHCWGRFHPAKRSVEIVDDQQPGVDDLYDLAAVETYMKGGRVVVLPEDQLPNGGKVTAVLRYRAG